MSKKIPVVVETEKEKKDRETIDTIATNIASLAKAVTNLLNGPLKKEAIVLLLTASSNCAKYQVENVLKAIQTLEADWLNKK